MSEQQDHPGQEPAGEAAAHTAKADAAPATISSGTNIVPYTPRLESGAATDRTESPRVTSKWATRRAARITAVAAIAGAVGAVSGSLATLGIGYLLQPAHSAVAAASGEAAALKQGFARLETELGVLKANTERAARGSAAQQAQTSDRLDKLARIQDEASAKLARVTDLQDKMRIAAATPAPVAAPAPVAPPAPEVTGSIAAAPAKTEARVAPAPILDNWVLAKVRGGGAIVAGRAGLYEVFPGDPLPGAGRVEAVRYQDGRWVVVTEKGLIIRR